MGSSTNTKNTARQIIIVGCQRSGTSALWRALRQHSLLRPSQTLPRDLPKGCEKELWFFNDFFRGRDLRNEFDRNCYFNRIDDEYLTNYFSTTEALIKKYFGGRCGDWLYSHPGDGLFCDQILSELPNSRIVFLIRHPQAVVWSSLYAPWQKKMSRRRLLLEARESAMHWRKFAAVHEKVKYGPFQGRMLTVYNESLRDDPENTLILICNFLELPYEAELLKEIEKGVFNSSFLSENEPIDKIRSSQKRIAMDAEYCHIVAKYAGPYMEAHGYRSFVDGQLQTNQLPTNAINTDSESHTNEEYWKNQLDWYSNEVARRKQNIPSYFSHEIFLDTNFRLYSQNIPPGVETKALEFGFGFGRHLKYLRNIKNIQFYGCDISPQAIEIAKDWNDLSNALELQLITPRSPLPYSDKYFDVVFTVSVLIHVKPDDVIGILTELLRVCNGHIIHIENPVTTWTYKTSDMHNGCWAHPFIDLYRHLGYQVECLPQISRNHGLYRITVSEGSIKPDLSETLASSLFSIEKLIERKNTDLATLNLKCEQFEEWKQTRTWKIRRFLGRHPKLESSITSGFDIAKSIANRRNKQRVYVTSRIRQPNNPSLSICHPNWRGVLSAAEGQSENLLLIPELSEDNVESAAAEIGKLKQRLFLFNGYWTNYDKLMILLRRDLPDCRILYTHHGSFYQMHEDRRQPNVLNTIITLYKNKVIDRIGFVKTGMAESIKHLGCPAWHVMNYVSPEPNPVIKNWKHPIRVALPFADKLRKNPDTQIVASLLLNDIDEVHVWHDPNIPYLRTLGADLNKIIVHRETSRDETRALLNSMTFTMYISISECFPMVLLESLAAATPCFTSNTHGVLEDFPDLAAKLLVSDADNPMAIAKHIENQISDLETLSIQSLEVYKSLSKLAKTSITEFTNFDNQ